MNSIPAETLPALIAGGETLSVWSKRWSAWQTAGTDGVAARGKARAHHAESRFMAGDTALAMKQIRCFHESVVASGRAILQRIRGRNGFDLVASQSDCR